MCVNWGMRVVRLIQRNRAATVALLCTPIVLLMFTTDAPWAMPALVAVLVVVAGVVVIPSMFRR